MSALHFIALGLVIALVIYLLLVLFNPEDFS
ncbi:potassium-transporting ATPase subunit F [Niveibacterium microcysteis]|uniref:Potassium-transporting ATPase subunit F n=1 Tax=Niveibacterium microcysteis TaxID=2811415 RepID=A0ABX7MF70_9RHOO|nr:potassium-transporting ATPase subunit F [Niveibacterium microcysteis]QSI78617.1 potassium-transporting ATPase subunit F [Niveibacterium microcysteis]